MSYIKKISLSDETYSLKDEEARKEIEKLASQIPDEIAEAIAKVVADAPEDLDTLKEIAEWIEGHADDAAAMNAQIQENKERIEEITTEGGEPNKIDSIQVNGETQEIVDKTVNIIVPSFEEVSSNRELASHIYEGIDLTEEFKEEISKFSDVWAWIKDRINNGNFEGLSNGDYIPMTLTTGEAHEMQINIDTYYNTGMDPLGHHIDFISKDCYSGTVQWGADDSDNNGTIEDASPYMVSNMYDFCNNTLYALIPSNVKDHIVEKNTIVETRYTYSGTLDESNSQNWKDIGKLWIPSEFEVFGSIVSGTLVWSAGQGAQYPIFEGGWLNKIKGAGPGGERCSWFLTTVEAGSTKQVCCVTYNGIAAGGSRLTREYYIPICFRIAAD